MSGGSEERDLAGGCGRPEAPPKRWSGGGGSIPAKTGATAAGIRTESPDELWGTDASRFWTKAEGWYWFFAAAGHRDSDVVGWRVAKKGDRWAALEPVQGVRAHMGGFGKAIALGLGPRRDWGLRYGAKQFQAEIKWLGIRSTPASTSANRSATASPSASSRRSRRSASTCTISETLRGGWSRDRCLHRAL